MQRNNPLKLPNPTEHRTQRRNRPAANALISATTQRWLGLSSPTGIARRSHNSAHRASYNPAGRKLRQNGGSARAYLADSPRRQRSSRRGHPRHDSERSLDIYADRRVPGTRAHAAIRALDCRGSVGRVSRITRRRTPVRSPCAARCFVGCENWAMGLDLGFYAARLYSLMRPPSTARRWIRCCERSAAGWSGRGGRSWRLRWGRCPL